MRARSGTRSRPRTSRFPSPCCAGRKRSTAAGATTSSSTPLVSHRLNARPKSANAFAVAVPGRSSPRWQHEGSVPIDHVKLPVSDLDATRAFYAAALSPLGWTLVWDEAPTLGFGRGDGGEDD